MKKAVVKLYTATELQTLSASAFNHAWEIHNYCMGVTRKPEEFIEDAKDALFLSNGNVWAVIDAEDADNIVKTGLTRGIALAVNYMIRHETAGAIWSAAGLTVRECIREGVDDFDLERLIPAYATAEDAEAVAGYWFKNFAEGTPQHTNAEEFLTALNEELINAGELYAPGAEGEDLQQKRNNSDTLIGDMKQAFIEIAKEIEA